jgi:hypothetical protein
MSTQLKTILVVEDSRDSRQILAETLWRYLISSGGRRGLTSRLV